MFIGREKEQKLIDELYTSDSFEFLILYGRRRVGKTSLLKEAAKGKNAVFFSAQEKNDALNLEDFSALLQKHFDGSSFGTFESWESACEYITNHTKGEKLLLIIDEFPFIAAENPSIKSILQHVIDHIWKTKNIMLVLCGSSVSFMEKEVMGYSSPLYGRSTAQLELKPFDYYDSARFFSQYSDTDKLVTYGILGGIPCYLERFSDKKSIAENLESEVLRTGSFLKEEPQALLRMELRDPAGYNSIFEAISSGASRMNDIAGKTRELTSKCVKYIATLRNLKLIDKLTPAGEDESARRTIYRITDNYFSFWYHFIFPERSYYEIIGPDAAAREIMQPENISDYMGEAYERICSEYMLRMAKKGSLPFTPHIIGKWWGNNPSTRRQDDVDILLLGRKNEQAIFCECKWRNTPFDKKELDDLKTAAKAFPHIDDKYYYLFSKSGFSAFVCDAAASDDHIRLITPEDMFK